ncbi:hypothetical protein, partial [Nocardiopsis alba]|uniref:hypothetical protein n=1 Tax=Nocardiopsis alba TaxID=53437 RepID=UPI003407D8FF
GAGRAMRTTRRAVAGSVRKFWAARFCPAGLPACAKNRALRRLYDRRSGDRRGLFLIDGEEGALSRHQA